MIKLISVNPSGFFGYGLHETIQLDSQGLILLEGLNGSGKSSLMNAVTTILFDENPLHVTGKSIINERLGKIFGSVTFIDSGCVKWRVICTRDWNKTNKYPDSEFDSEPSEWHEHGERYSGTDVYLERWDESKSKWIDERPTSVAGAYRLDLKATRKKLLTILGITYQQYMSIGYLAQQQSLRFANGTHKERMEVIAELSDICTWDKRRDKVKNKIRELETEISYSKATVTGSKDAGLFLQEPDPNSKSKYLNEITSLKDLVSQCDIKLPDLHKEKDVWTTKFIDIDKSITALKQKIRDLVSQRRVIEMQYEAAFRNYNTNCMNIKSRPLSREYETLNSEIKLNKGAISTRRWDLEQLLPGSGKCPRCRSIVSDKHLDREKQLLSLSIKETEDKIENDEIKLRTIYEEWELKVSEDLDIAESEWLIVKNEINTISGTTDALISAAESQIEELRYKRDKIGQGPDVEIVKFTNQRMQYLSSISLIEQNLRIYEDDLDKWNKFHKSVKEAESKIIELEVELKYLHIVERLFGDKGIKAHKISVVIDQLNESIQKFLDIITDESIKVWITPFREKIDGDISTDIQIMVNEGTKTKVPYDLYSGGEKGIITLALIGAFWTVASAQGSGLNCLMLDECFSALDESNREAACRLVDYFKSSRSTVIVVTHDVEIKNFMTFDHVWAVTKNNDQSKLVIDPN